MTRQFDVLVIGAGPAGLAAAHAAAVHGASVGIVDDNPLPGGQIWRAGQQQQCSGPAATISRAGAAPDHASEDARHALQAARNPDPTRQKRQNPSKDELLSALRAAANVTFLQQASVLYAPAPDRLLVQTPDSSETLEYGQLILATGARELLLPFPGWTLSGVTGAGGLQALAKGGYPVQGKRVVVAGSGPLLLAVAATLKERGAHVVAIVEQAGLSRLAQFALGLAVTPGKIGQALQLAGKLRGVPYYSNSYVRAARGGADGMLREIELQRGGATELLECDYLACGYGLAPNLELALALGCAITARRTVQVDQWQRTSIPNIFCAGEGTGIGGVDKALAEGRIAGLLAVGRQKEAQSVFGERVRWQGFARRLERAFMLRDEIRALADDDTIVCRCEDVSHGELRGYQDWRGAKLHTRCGMGPCQGRICGNATDILYGWRPESVRVPLVPARIGSACHSRESGNPISRPERRKKMGFPPARE
ncbi:MAG: FAD-dependent oxidoreductase [Pseudomonadota bacterium]